MLLLFIFKAFDGDFDRFGCPSKIVTRPECKVWAKFLTGCLAKTVKNFDESCISRQNILECRQKSIDNKLTYFSGYSVSNVINVIARQQTNEVKLFI